MIQTKFFSEERSFLVVDYLGSIMCSLSLFYSENNNLLKAASSGLTGIKYLKRCNAINSGLKEPLLYIGIFEYYKYRFAGKIDFVNLLKDNKKNSVRQIKSVIDTGINRFLGRNRFLKRNCLF